MNNSGLMKGNLFERGFKPHGVGGRLWKNEQLTCRKGWITPFKKNLRREGSPNRSFTVQLSETTWRYNKMAIDVDELIEEEFEHSRKDEKPEKGAVGAAPDTASEQSSGNSASRA